MVRSLSLVHMVVGRVLASELGIPVRLDLGLGARRLVVAGVGTAGVHLLLALGGANDDDLVADGVFLAFEDLGVGLHGAEDDEAEPLKFISSLPLVFPVFESLTT